MPHNLAPLDGGDAGMAAVIQVLIARTREQLCEACAEASPQEEPVAVSVRVPGTELFVITPAATELHAVGPAQTSVIGLDGHVVGSAWDSRTSPSPAAAAHAAAYIAARGAQDADIAHAVASTSGRLAHASTPAAALLAVAEQIGSSPATGARTDSDSPLPTGKINEPHHNRRSTQ